MGSDKEALSPEKLVIWNQMEVGTTWYFEYHDRFGKQSAIYVIREDEFALDPNVVLSKQTICVYFNNGQWDDGRKWTSNTEVIRPNSIYFR